MARKLEGCFKSICDLHPILSGVTALNPANKMPASNGGQVSVPAGRTRLQTWSKLPKGGCSSDELLAGGYEG